MIGVEECLQGQDFRSVSCECSSTHGFVYYIRREDFVERVMSRPESLAVLKESVERKSKEKTPLKIEPPKVRLTETDKLRYYIAKSPKRKTRQENVRKASCFSLERDVVYDLSLIHI